MLLDGAGLGSQSLPDLGTVPSKRPPKLKQQGCVTAVGLQTKHSRQGVRVVVSSCHNKVNMALACCNVNLPARPLSSQSAPQAASFVIGLQSVGTKYTSSPPKKTSTRLRSQVITYRHRGNKSRIVLSRPRWCQLRLEGSPRSRVAMVARSLQALLGSALPGNSGTARSTTKCVPATLELLIRVLFFKQTIFFPDFIMS